jgi:DNA mismatch repair protein MutS2
MIDKTLSYLDYSRLLEVLKHYSSTPYIEDSIETLTSLQDVSRVNERLDKVEAVMEVVKWDGRIPFYEVPDVRGILTRLRVPGSVLEPKGFLGVSGLLRNCSDVAGFLSRAHIKKPFVNSLIERILPLTRIFEKISKTISSEGFIEDTASYELSRIRSDIFVLKERARRKLEKMMEAESVRPILQDTYISLRNDRYVIPVKPNFNQAFQGIVHDYSHSLKTSFVEPMEVVDLNNSINILENEAVEEEKNILLELTNFVRAAVDALTENMEVLKELDFIHSVALFSGE